jgi:hypothetical protein
MENALPVYVVDRFQQLVHVSLHFLLLEVFVPDKAFIEILLHKFEDQGELP